MPVMHVLELRRGAERLAFFEMREEWVDVGSHPGCQLCVHDAAVAQRRLLLHDRGGILYAYDWSLSPSGPPARFTLGYERPYPVGQGYLLVRRSAGQRKPSEPETGGLETGRVRSVGGAFELVVGKGNEARRIRIEGEPIQVGTAPINHVVLTDVTVSRLHCRIEPHSDGTLRVRDLGSRNGTYVDGLRVDSVSIARSAAIRVGRTTLLLEDAEASDAEQVVAASDELKEVMTEVSRVSKVTWPVVILGESGVGKERIARAIHQNGPRAARPFVAVNAAGFTRELIESELFGHEKGAFSGAVAQHKGAFEQAQGGTLFLDEIGELPLDVQARLLRVLETWEIRRVGGERTFPVDVRVMSATHRDLRQMIVEGAFREDLYYRLARASVYVPPLRERPADIGPLAMFFLKDIRREIGERRLSEAGLARLLSHDWPGNARELRNVLSVAALSACLDVIEGEDVERAINTARSSCERLRLVTHHQLDAVVGQYQGNASAAARALGVPRSTLRDRIKREAYVRASAAVRENRVDAK